MSLILTLTIWTLLGAITAYFASQRGRDPMAWFAIGMFLGILGLLLLFILKPIKEEAPVVIQEPLEVIEKGDLHDDLFKDWFCLDKTTQQLGPISFDALKDLWMEGKIDNLSFVWCEGMGEWKKINDLPAIYQRLHE